MKKDVIKMAQEYIDTHTKDKSLSYLKGLIIVRPEGKISDELRKMIEQLKNSND